MTASLPAGAIHMASGTYGIDTIRALEAAHAKPKQTLIAVPVLGRPISLHPVRSGWFPQDRKTR